MNQYAKYFKNGQKVLLKVVNAGNGYFEALTVFFHDHGPGFIELSLPYHSAAGEEYPLTPGMQLELSADALGMGVRMAVTFQEYTANRDVIRVALAGELQLFQRRYHRRVDTSVGIRYSRGQGTLRSFREQWRKNLEILQQTRPDSLPPFPESQINLSNGGIRLIVKPPIQKADLFLVLLQLRPQEIPVCALAEVVWMGEAADGRIVAGMQFIGIIESDRKRIDVYLQQLLVASGQAT